MRSMGLYHYRLHATTGEEIDLHSAIANWRVGDEVLTGDGRRWIILDLVDFDELRDRRGFLSECCGWGCRNGARAIRRTVQSA